MLQVTNSRAYWRMLKRLNKNNDYPHRMRDPEDSSTVIDDLLKIRDALTKYWANLGNSNTNAKKDQMDKITEIENQPPNPTSFHFINIDDASL